MANWAFNQTDFTGGEWSEAAQGRLTDAKMKTALNVCRNSYALEEGSWTRRPGFRYLGITRHGAPGRLLAFDFTQAQPYQLELTDGYMRFWSAFAPVYTADGLVPFTGITGDTPAKLIMTSVPAGWLAGDTVAFTLTNNPSWPQAGVANRTFTLGTVGTGYATLLDPVTGAPMDGTTLAYVPGTSTDYVSKILEIATPYTGGAWKNVRAVQYTDGTAQALVLLCPGFAPRQIDGSFTFTTPAFQDGPYLDENTTATTLSCSGTSGSVTVTASALTGINGGAGFLSTDVGRLIRFEDSPADWASGTTYATADLVLGSDGNVYQAVVGGNIGNNPTTDDGTSWLLSSLTVSWTWLVITAVTDTSDVVATISGPALSQARATAHWRLGVFCDTVGWPTCGVFHESRLWLGGAVLNRIDGSQSNGPFNFADTEVDSSVIDSDAIAAVFTARENNSVFWMLSTDDGLTVGTLAGEWRVQASALDDPISPTSIQFRRVSTFGSANIEPVEAYGTVFTQAARRKLLAHKPISTSRYGADNLAIMADHLTYPGIAEIRWQQEPNLQVWSRYDDGSFTSMGYKRAFFTTYDVYGSHEAYQGYARHDFSNGRALTSISTGPSYDGLSTALYAVSNQSNSSAPDYNVSWVEVMMPVFVPGAPSWSALNVDHSVSPSSVRYMYTSTGDAYDGLRIYGLWHLNGQTACGNIAGVDTGDVPVAGGYADFHFGADPDGLFTLGLLAASPLIPYSTYGGPLSWIETSSVPATIPGDEAFAYQATSGSPDQGNDVGQGWNRVANTFLQYDTSTNTFLQFNGGGATLAFSQVISPGLYGLGLGDAWGGLSTVGESTASGGQWLAIIEGGTAQCSRIHFLTVGASSVTEVGYYGENLGIGWDGVDGHGGCIAAAHSTLGFDVTSGSGGVERIYAQSEALAQHAVSFISVDAIVTSGGIGLVGSSVLGSTSSWKRLTLGPQQSGATYVYTAEVSVDNGSGYPASIRFWEWIITPGPTVSQPRDIGLLNSTDLNAGWTEFLWWSFLYDRQNGGIVIFGSGYDGSVGHGFVAKVDRLTGALVYNVAGPSWFDSGTGLAGMESNISNYGTVGFMNGSDLNLFDLSTGAATTHTFPDTINPSGAELYDEASASLYTAGGVLSKTTGSGVNYIGPYLGANTVASHHVRISFGFNHPGVSSTTYVFPASVGQTYTSQGQLCRPDQGQDAGAQAGPAFGKKRRLHWWGAHFVATQKVKAGVDFSSLDVVRLQDQATTAVVPPDLFSGIVSTTVACDYSWDGMLAWETDRPYPCTLSIVAGYLATQDK